MITLRVRSSAREQMVDFTSEVERQISSAGFREGVCILFSQHTTAGVTVNENADPDVPHDILLMLGRLIPQDAAGFRHGEGNSDAHIKTSLVGTSVTIPVHDGRLMLGRWQGVFLCEFDGPRERKVAMTLR